MPNDTLPWVRLGHVVVELRTVICILMKNRKQTIQELALGGRVERTGTTCPVLCLLNGVANQALVSAHVSGAFTVYIRR